MIAFYFSIQGWGHWGGKGTRPSKKRIVIPVDPSKVKPRKDTGMKYVIINEERDKKAAKHLVRETHSTCINVVM